MADAGHEVLVYDIDPAKIAALSSGKRDSIENILFERDLADYILKHKDRLTFTSAWDDVKQWLEQTDAVFLCLPTPEKNGQEGESDMSYYQSALASLGPALAVRNNNKQDHYVVIINKSTVPLETADMAQEILAQHGARNFGVVSNPEFLVEGQAVHDSVHPTRVVIGASSKKDFEIMRQVYARWYNVPRIAYVEVNPFEAAAGKLLANYLLFSRLANTFDVVGRLCEVFPHMRFEQVRKVLTTDPRIGTWGFYDSLHAGGSCFIKDAASLAYQLEQKTDRTALVRDALEANRYQLQHFFDRAAQEAHFDFKGKTVALLGAAFKQETNDVRHSGALGIIELLLENNVKQIRVYDPVAYDSLHRWLLTAFGSTAQQRERYGVPLNEKIVHCFNAEEVWSPDTSCTFIATDWREFQQLPQQFQKLCKSPHLIMDGRRIWCHAYDELQQAGYDIIAVGSPFLKAIPI